jgi:hypothetical protein
MIQGSQRYNFAVIYASYDSQIASLTNLIYVLGLSGRSRCRWIGFLYYKLGLVSGPTSKSVRQSAFCLTESGYKSRTKKIWLFVRLLSDLPAINRLTYRQITVWYFIRQISHGNNIKTVNTFISLILINIRVYKNLSKLEK